MGLKLPLDIVESAGVCQNCFIKFNEIDEHQMIAEKLQNELITLFNSNTSTTVVTEIKEDVEDAKESVIEEILQTDEMIEEYYVGEEEVVLEEDIRHFESTIVPKVEKIEQKPLVRRPYVRRRDPDAGLIMVFVDGQRQYQCDLCNRICKDRYKLKNHRETHTTERNVRCDGEFI